MTTKYLSQYNDTTARTVGFKGTAAGQVATWSDTGQEWAPGPGVGGSGGGGEIFYFNFGNTTVTPTGAPLPQSTTSTPTTSPSLLGPTYNPSATSVESADLTDGSYSLVAGFLTAAGEPGVTALPAGLWDFNIWASSTAAANATQVQIQARVYIAAADGATYGNAAGGAGSGTPLAVSDAVYLYELANIAQYILNVTIPQTTIGATDRLYIEFWAQKNINSTRTVTFSFATNQPSHVHTTIYVPINLATEVTGILPLVNGGLGVDGTAITANTVFAGPATGSPDDATFRALVAADVAGITPYDLRGAFIGNPASSAVIDRFVADRAFTISATAADHQFYASALPSTGTVTLTAKKTPISGGGAVTVFVATYTAGGSVSNNGLYAATIGAVSNNSIAVGDLVSVEVGTTEASFQTPVWTIYGTA